MKKKHKIILITVSLFVAICLGGGNVYGPQKSRISE